MRVEMRGLSMRFGAEAGGRPVRLRTDAAARGGNATPFPEGGAPQGRGLLGGHPEGGAPSQAKPEVGVVIERHDGPLPIDTCLCGGGPPDLRGIEAFMAEFGCGEALAVSDGWLEARPCRGGVAACIPFWMI